MKVAQGNGIPVKEIVRGGEVGLTTHREGNAVGVVVEEMDGLYTSLRSISVVSRLLHLVNARYREARTSDTTAMGGFC
jgi:hypothetical protein